MNDLSSVRRRLLFGWRHGELAYLSGELTRIDPAAGARPVLGSKLEHALARPEGRDAGDVAQVKLGVEPVELGGRNESHKIGRGRGMVITAAEVNRPGFSGDSIV